MNGNEEISAAAPPPHGTSGEPTLLPPPPPRVWPSMVLTLGLIPANALVAGILVIAAVLFSGKSDLLQDSEGLVEWISEFMITLPGILIFFLPSQMLFLGSTFLAGAISPTPFLERLGLVRWKLPTSTVVLLILATPLAQFFSVLFISLLGLEPSAQLEQLTRVFVETEGSAFALTLILTTLGAGFSEELLFRGYLQRRLLQAWSPSKAIATSALLFALMHLDPVHASGVLFLGVWFSIVAWLTGSVIPAMIAHGLNNLLAILALVLSGKDEDDLASMGPAYFAMIGLGAMFAVLAFLSLRAHRRRLTNQLSFQPSENDNVQQNES